ncbi:Speract/scavenger receptor-related protein [Pseudocohnilembus persalinus]|uniref:Speract/scavenger receptor-related protein n=1 Tax=Pseudocohnilembus persalinus TaxID=266149 RepID=A0A0V0R5G3_PSEPJ|nr:Speract/scavenger receptor-related protein [Pseudocohnilembus persalinus]|eukprot:KRX09741.1 Speract/scavenger receptor-related protein [Pseudocohnilembus persalinus]
MSGATQQQRITFDLTASSATANLASSNPDLYDHLNDVLSVCALYFNNLIGIADGDLQEPIIYTAQEPEEFSIPSDDKTTGVYNTDTHIYVHYLEDETQSFVANAASKQDQGGNGRPLFGQININGYYFVYDGTNSRFEYNLETVLHELFHVFGLSGSNKLTSGVDYDEVDGVKQIKMPSVVAYAQEYYDDATITYVPFENEGGSGSKGAHWERMAMQNELMTASVIYSDAAISKFTLAFLNDLGIYETINYDMAEESMQWGRGRGEDFLTNTDCGNDQYNEYTKTQQTDQCDFYHFGYGQSTVDTFTNGCYVIKMYSNGDCTNPNLLSGDSDYTYEVNGINSKCFMSSIQSNNSPYKCYQYYCDTSNNLYVQFMSEGKQVAYLKCENDGDVLDAPSGMSGTLTCPADISQFCNFPIPCKNYCSGKGYCLRRDYDSDGLLDSKCHCIDGYAGEDCSVQCSTGQYALVNKNNCVNDCSANGYDITDEDNHVCYYSSCDSSCYSNNQICDGPSSGDCTDCDDGKYYYNQECVYSCPDDYVSLDGKSCTSCPNNSCLSYDEVKIKNKQAQISYNDEYRNICPSLFGENDAYVFCKSAGFKTFKSYSTSDSCSDSSSGYWVSGVSCQGNENNIDECDKTITGSCSSGGCVNIECTNDSVADYDILTVKDTYMLIFHEKSYGSICYGSYANYELSSICKSMGKGNYKSNFKTKCSENIKVTNLSCESSSDGIGDCDSNISEDNLTCESNQCIFVECKEDESISDLLDSLTDKIDGSYIILGFFLLISIIFMLSTMCAAKKISQKGEFRILSNGQKEPTEVSNDLVRSDR